MIYDYFLQLVRFYPPHDVIEEFKTLFFEYRPNADNAQAFQKLKEILTAKKRDQIESEFINTLKRCSYILINNWETRRKFEAIGDFVESFKAISFDPKTATQRDRIRQKNCLKTFVESQDYQDLLLFTKKYHKTPKEQHWSSRYTSYLLVPQYANAENSPEQREAARTLSRQLKQEFKFDLAMFTARSQSGVTPNKELKNPTGLGEEVLRMVKKIVIRHGQFSYQNLAHIFLKQIEGISYRDFKEALLKYLLFSVDQNSMTAMLQNRLKYKLDDLYVKYNEETVTDALILRTCNQVFSILTTENEETPSETFIFLLSQGNPLTLVIVLLKLFLICPNARTHLETKIAHLIDYYRDFPEEECKWVVNFFEVFNITFAIYADNDVQYELIRMKSNSKSPDSPSEQHSEDAKLDNYRIFSQHRNGNG